MHRPQHLEKGAQYFIHEGQDTRDDLCFHKSLKLALLGCHASLAAVRASLGALGDVNDTWRSYASSLCIELFQDIKHAEVRQQHQIGPVEKIAHGF